VHRRAEDQWLSRAECSSGPDLETYALGEFRRQQLKADRVRDDSTVVDDAKVAHSGDSAESRTWWRIGPGDQDFLTRPFRCISWRCRLGRATTGMAPERGGVLHPGGRGYEIHDDQRYDWAKDDLVFVHADSVHRHFNPYDEKALALVVKAKCTGCSWG